MISSGMIIKILVLALVIFCTGLFFTIASRNILKIFIGLVFMFNSSLLVLNIWQNPANQIIAAVLSFVTLITGAIGLFLITKVYKKFNTFDIDEIEKIAKGDK